MRINQFCNSLKHQLRNIWIINTKPNSVASHSRCRTFCILNRNYPSVYKKLLLKDKISNSIFNWTSRCYSTKLRDQFSIFNQEYQNYLESFENELKELYENDSVGNKVMDGRERQRQTQKLHNVNSIVQNLQEKFSEYNELLMMAKSDDSNDKDMKQMIETDLENCLQTIKQMEETLVHVIVGENSLDSNDIVVEIYPGVGGQEAMLFTGELFEMYQNYVAYKGWSHEVLSLDVSEQGGLRKGSLAVSGKDAFKHLRLESGVHRVQRVPKTEKKGRVHTSTVTVAVLPEPTEIDVVLNTGDLKVQSFRASGPGGQHVNSTDSAVRVTHLPTGVSVECQETRFQSENQSRALQKLRSRLYQKEIEAQMAESTASRKLQIGTGGRNEKIRTYNYKDDRVSDHRLNFNVTNLPGFLDGGQDLDFVIQNLLSDIKYKILEAMIHEFHEKSRKAKKAIKQ